MFFKKGFFVLILACFVPDVCQNYKKLFFKKGFLNCFDIGLQCFVPDVCQDFVELDLDFGIVVNIILDGFQFSEMNGRDICLNSTTKLQLRKHLN